MSKITKPSIQPKPIAPGGDFGGIRPMYGISIRDDLSKFRGEIGKTITDTKLAIKEGDPKGPQVFGDGVLQGKELKDAKKALKHLEQAQKALKPVFGELPGPTPLVRPPNPQPNWRGGGDNLIRPMYGIALRDDLAGFRSSIKTTQGDIRKAISAGQLTGKELTEANKALKYLDAALKDLTAA
jgi:hypothetical protein